MLYVCSFSTSNKTLFIITYELNWSEAKSYLLLKVVKKYNIYTLTFEDGLLNAEDFSKRAHEFSLIFVIHKLWYW